ncbi:MAG: hypothetical protein WC369_09420 [Dehalococcoidales bacterium]|jgi:hypothetical protein
MKEVTRREFLKKNLMLAAAMFFIGGVPGKLAEYFGRKANVSDKEARYYRTLAG